ncbi:MAG TPA: diguanylate cyclase [Candidatus Acidoferrum sp.]|nr:diguanylate cyclase [Candidatus Acidoferrum sp.]
MREEQAYTCLILLSSRESKESWVIVKLVTRDILRSRREGSCTAVMMCDIDHFKRINNCFGHVGSDTVLREVRVGCRTPCVPTTWWGAMEARNSWWHTQPLPFRRRRLARRGSSQGTGNQPFLVGEKRLTVTISVGLALTNEFGNCSVDKIVNHADMVLYAAKAAGLQLCAYGSRCCPERSAWE